VRGRGQRGQALSEYGILLALASGLRWLEAEGTSLLDHPPTTLLLVIGGVLVVAYLVSTSGRRV
jgi:hypothetical protein